jgi:hypothetical protein
MCLSDVRLCLLSNDVWIDKMDAMTDDWTNNSPRENKTLEEPVFMINSPILILHSALQLNLCENVRWRDVQVKFNDIVQMVQIFLGIYKQTHDSYWSQYFLLS